VLGPATPNPFAPASGGTRLTVALSAAGDVRLAIYDVAGRLVRSLVDGHRAAGTHPVRWEGRNDAGRAVAPGVYYVRLEVAGERVVRSVVHVR
jgi:flagellar hook assembly protein FlgD